MSRYTRTLELKGHIIDSLTFSKLLDEILEQGGDYVTEELRIGKTSRDQSYARLTIAAPNPELLQKIVARVKELGGTEMENLPGEPP